MGKVTSNTDMTFARIYNAALKRFVGMGFNGRSAILNAAYYAAHKTKKA